MTSATTSATLSGIIFDMDGVLCDSEPFITEAAAQMFKQRHGLSVSHADFLPFTGTGEDRFLGGVAEKYGVTLAMPEDKQLTYAIYTQIIRGRLHPLAGAVEFIGDCRRRGLKLAVASSADKIKVDANLAEIGLPPATFDVVINGLQVQRKKPNPDIFLMAAERLGLAPARCLVIEDAVSGIQAGKAAGSVCLGLTTSFSAEALRAAGADWIAPDLAHVPADLSLRLAR